MKQLSLLGSTGSIGTQTLDVIRLQNRLYAEGKEAEPIKLQAVCAGHNVTALEEQIREFSPKLAVLYDEKAAQDLKTRVRDLPVQVSYGMDGLCEAASMPSADITLNAVVGMIGLLPTLTAVRSRKPVALANKETLVAGGALVMKEAKERGRAHFAGGQRTFRHFPVLAGVPRARGRAQIGAHGVRRAVLRQKAGRADTGNARTGAAPPQLEHGPKSDHRFGYHDEQRAGNHGSRVAFLHAAGADRCGGAPGKRGAFPDRIPGTVP